ncbi:MAG: PaaI family thioesterase [Candidatus Hydrogenedentota bacterium]|mgnify:FL=1|nr:PaaI family thioesterase [Candidatus Sumerlaea chitinivorans]RMH25809.1 MAG: PaaI family thioesterase [Candidatus Hydrogenedentota bacterium]
MDTLKQWQAYFAKDQFATGNGIELVEIGPGRAVARMTVEPRHYNAVGSVMGGALFTLADFAFAAASNSHGTVAVATDCSISFLRPAFTGTLTAEARELSRGRTLAHYDVMIRDEQERLVAVFHGTVYRKNEPIRRG